MGLREKHKKRRRRIILDAAKRLFVRRGYGATTMQEIAASADVGVGTVYNYFGSKQRLMLAVVGRDAASFYDKPLVIDKSPLEAAYAYVCETMEFILSYGRELVREIMTATTSEKHAGESDKLTEVDWRSVSKLTEMFEHFDRSGGLASDVEPAKLAWICYSIMMTELMLFAFDSHRSEHELKKSVRASLEVALRGNTIGSGRT
jgi:AcrR family transcriptional regulator